MAEMDGDRLCFRADLFSPDGAERIGEDRMIHGTEEASAIAAEMLAKAPARIRAVFGGAS